MHCSRYPIWSSEKSDRPIGRKCIQWYVVHPRLQRLLGVEGAAELLPIFGTYALLNIVAASLKPTESRSGPFALVIRPVFDSVHAGRNSADDDVQTPHSELSHSELE